MPHANINGQRLYFEDSGGSGAPVVHGEADTALTIDKGEALAAGLVGCSGIVRIPGAAHAANLTHADLVNPPLLEFLRSLPA